MFRIRKPKQRDHSLWETVEHARQFGVKGLNMSMARHDDEPNLALALHVNESGMHAFGPFPTVGKAKAYSSDAICRCLIVIIDLVTVDGVEVQVEKRHRTPDLEHSHDTTNPRADLSN